MDVGVTPILLSGGAFAVSCAALIVAVLDWAQIGREEPWKLTKVADDIWLLERVHRSPAVILSLLNFHGSEVVAMNDAGFPVGRFRRGRKETFYIAGSHVGTYLDVSYRRDYKGVLRRILGAERFEWLGAGHFAEGRGVKHWSTPIY